MPEGEEEEQETENLLEKIMKKKTLPQSGKGNRLLGSPGSSEESQRTWTQGGTHQDKKQWPK